MDRAAPRGGKRAGLSVTGTWARGTGDATALAIAAPDGAAAWIDLTALDPGGEAAVGAWLEDQKRPKAMHDAKGPIEALAARAGPCGGSRATRSSRRTWSSRTSGPTTSTTSSCAT